MTKGNLRFAVLAATLLLASSAEARFYQADPVGYGDDLNLYTYVGNDPTDKTDPMGDQAIPIAPLIAPPPPIPGQQGQPTTAQIIEHILNNAQGAVANSNAPAPPNGPIPGPFVPSSEIPNAAPIAAINNNQSDADRVKAQRDRRNDRRDRDARNQNGQKPPGTKNKGPSGDRPAGPDRRDGRERNVGIDEEHSVKPKGSGSTMPR